MDLPSLAYLVVNVVPTPFALRLEHILAAGRLGSLDSLLKHFLAGFLWVQAVEASKHLR